MVAWGLVGQGGWRQQQQAVWWKEYIAWERSNPQRLDKTAHSQRVTLAYEQALIPLMHYPEVPSLPSLPAGPKYLTCRKHVDFAPACALRS